jgi:hypothetical protein
MSKREIDAAAISPSLDDDSYEMQRPGKRSKLGDEISGPFLLKRRGSSVGTNFNVCNSNNAVVNVCIAVNVGHSDVRDCREQSDDRSITIDGTQEMRDMTETIRDMGSMTCQTRMP